MKIIFFISKFTNIFKSKKILNQTVSLKEMEEIKNLDEKFSSIIEENAKKNGKSIWIEPETIIQLTGSTMTQYYQVIDASNNIVENKGHKITTRKLYQEKTPFYTKLINSFKNRID